jgi:hypothetical protein
MYAHTDVWPHIGRRRDTTRKGDYDREFSWPRDKLGFYAKDPGGVDNARTNLQVCIAGMRLDRWNVPWQRMLASFIKGHVKVAIGEDLFGVESSTFHRCMASPPCRE